MTTPPLSLDTLPIDILCHIAKHTNEKTIWATMSSCRSLREAGEKALTPYLSRQKVTASPTFLIDPFNSIPTHTATGNSRLRRESLLAVDQRFTDHLIVHPRSAEFLQHLTLEVRGQDDGSMGWNLLKRFLPQLVSLDLHVYEPVDDDDEEDESNGYDSDDYPFPRGYGKEERSIMFDIWENIDRNWGCVLGENQFPNLTTLSISTTFRAFEHFLRISERTPNLRSLTLGAHWAITDFYQYPVGNLGQTTEPTLTNLTELTLIGGEQMIIDALVEILTPAANLSSITIHLLDVCRADKRHSHGTPVELPPMASRKRITRLALYGDDVFSFMRTHLYRQRKLSLDATFQTITHLVLEREFREITEEECIDPEGWDVGQEEMAYPLLSHCMKHRPPFSALEHIIFIDREVDEAGKFTLGRHAVVDDFFWPSKLRRLFRRYPTLKQVMWVAGYPINPFDPSDASTWLERNVKCVVNRPEIPTTPFEPMLAPTFRPRKPKPVAAK